MAETAAPPKPRYGKEVVGKRLKILSPKDNKWRTGAVKAYHGGYYRHMIEFDDGETLNTHLYSEEYKFLPDSEAESPPHLKVGSSQVSVYWPEEDRWLTGKVVAFDGYKHTVRYDDSETEHFDLQRERYKLVESGSAAPSSETRAAGRSSRSKVDEPVLSGSAHKQRERQRSVPPAAPGAVTSGKSAGNKSSRPTSAASAAANERLAAVAADKDPADRSPPERSSDKAGGTGAAYGKDTRGGNGDKERRSSSAGAAAGSKQTSAGPAAAAGNASAAAANKKLPLLNMSHVSKKDREAARMLLGFSSPAGQEGYFASQPSGADTKAGQTANAAAAGRLAIAAAAAAAAAAAGLPDPSADLYPSSGGASPVAGPCADRSAAAAAGGGMATSGGAGGLAPAGSGALEPGATSAAVAAMSSELLAGMQWQMQQLVQQEENRWVEVNRLNSQVTRLQRERDEAVRARDSAMVERDVALAQMKQLQDEKDSLASQVDNLERDIVNLTAQLSVERGMISNASIDAAQLRVQLTGMRNELAGCKHEAAQVYAAIRGISGAGYGTGMGTMSVGYGNTAVGNSSAAAAAAGATMIGMGSAAAGTYGATGMYGMMDGLDPAAAAATAAPPPPPPPSAAAAGGFTASKKTAFTQKLGPGQTSVTSSAHPASAPAPAVRSSSGDGGRVGNISQLMQVGPGTLVVGPRSRRAILPEQPTAAYAPTAANAAAQQSALVETLSQPAQDPVQSSAADVAYPAQQEEQLSVQQQTNPLQKQDEAANAALDAAAAAGITKQAGGQSSDMNNGHAAAVVGDEGAAADQAAAATHLASETIILEPDAAAVGLTTSEAALAADDDDSVSEVAAVDQPAHFSVDAAGRRPGRPSRKPSSGNTVPDASIRPDGKSLIAGVEAMVGKKRIRSSDSPTARHVDVEQGSAGAIKAAVLELREQHRQHQLPEDVQMEVVFQPAAAGTAAALQSIVQPTAVSIQASPQSGTATLQHAEGADGHVDMSVINVAADGTQHDHPQINVVLATEHEPEGGRSHQLDASAAADLQNLSRKRQKVVG